MADIRTLATTAMMMPALIPVLSPLGLLPSLFGTAEATDDDEGDVGDDDADDNNEDGELDDV
jgi:hypothetical protein